MGILSPEPAREGSYVGSLAPDVKSHVLELTGTVSFVDSGLIIDNQVSWTRRLRSMTQVVKVLSY